MPGDVDGCFRRTMVPVWSPHHGELGGVGRNGERTRQRAMGGARDVRREGTAKRGGRQEANVRVRGGGAECPRRRHGANAVGIEGECGGRAW